MNGPTTTAAGEQTSAKPPSPVDEMLRSLEPYRVSVGWLEYVRSYLEKYPELIPHILPTVERARQEFGDAAGLTLTINDDPEIYDPYLRLYVRLPKYDREADERLESMTLSLGEAIADLEGYFRVTADFRSPAR
jgi:hypothetical protein